MKSFFIKPKSFIKKCAFGFLDSYFGEQNNLYSQCLYSFNVKLAVFYE